MAKYDYLVIDIGSTYTKLRLFKDCRLVAKAQAPTTIKNVYEGITRGRAEISAIIGDTSIDVRHVLATSSAAGGLRMVAMGYMARVTAKAAKEVAMNSGARVLEIVSQEDPPDYRIEILKEINPDIILLAGGTDGGDESSIIENANLIVKSGVKAVVVIAGNLNAQPEAAKILHSGGVDYERVPNIMPTIHELRVKEAREAIHRQFIRQITKAKGLAPLKNEITTDKIIPTPGAVLMATELLAKGNYDENGFGDLVLIDLGGATTDVHSVLPSLEKLNDEEKGLIVANEKQVSYRTVEGNLGMRISAKGILDEVGSRSLLKRRNISDKSIEEKLIQYILFLEKNPEYIPVDEKEKLFDELLAETAVEIALKKHAGFITQEFDPIMGTVPGMPIGRDLREVKYIIGVGGFFVHNELNNAHKIIKNAIKKPGFSLLPENPEILIDKNYLVYAAGAISQIDQEYAFTVLKNHFEYEP
ncbi:glutamate mutase L [Tepidanaerobacter syntrophicus]|uniref:glutamate mutase L n=1 Tax=Tepidanaerobacter syntrophicus TaxID=224999 RepID=UPI001BD4DB96|nr:glutamate mutase L [Tepidanaerobacter syntrophicus]